MNFHVWFFNQICPNTLKYPNTPQFYTTSKNWDLKGILWDWYVVFGCQIDLKLRSRGKRAISNLENRINIGTLWQPKQWKNPGKWEILWQMCSSYFCSCWDLEEAEEIFEKLKCGPFKNLDFFLMVLLKNIMEILIES